MVATEAGYRPSKQVFCPARVLNSRTGVRNFGKFFAPVGILGGSLTSSELKHTDGVFLEAPLPRLRGESSLGHGKTRELEGYLQFRGQLSTNIM